nr:class I SAM-dependent methyltransferase [uncultured Acetatifactor sp.]
MIEKADVIEFFDRNAPGWDAELVRDDAVIERILDNGGIVPGCHALDVACGTGVLFPDYIKRKVGSVTAVDISPGMAEIAGKKSRDTQIQVICGDVEALTFHRLFDCCMVYNAFPHFPNPERLIQVLAGHLRPEGRLSIAHGMSRDKINERHGGAARRVSEGLMEARELAELFAPYFKVDTVISDERMYQVSGVKLREG